MSWTAVVLAGSRPGGDALAQRFGADLKALIPVAGEPMVRRPVRALLANAQIGKILVLSEGPDRIAAELAVDPRIECRISQGTIAETLLDLVDDPATDWPLLVTTADHALLDAATIDEFIAAGDGCNIAVGVVARENMLRRLPQTARTWLRLRGGGYTGANLFMLKSASVRAAIELWRSVEQDRKKAWRVLSLLGPVVSFGALLRILTLEQVTARLSARLGLTVRAVPLSNPLAGVDVDKAADHALVEAILRGEA